MALIIVMILLLLGIGGTILPLLPGIPLMFVSIAAYGWYEGFNTITPKYVCILAALTVISLIVDYLSTVLGAKYFGSSKKGMWGALLGTFIGLFLFPPLGLLLGPFLGAMIGEYIEIQDVEKAVKIGVGTVVGLFSGMVFKLVLAIGMFVSFLIVVF
jgi:hypothetical protein